MTGDFPDLRTTVRDSVIGSFVLSTANALGLAWSDAVVVRTIRPRLEAMRGLPAATAVQCLSIIFATAAISAWALSRLIPIYLGTSIPDWAYGFGAVMFTAAAIWPESVARQWSRSTIRRVTLWIRQA